jgi:hypothetical protein
MYGVDLVKVVDSRDEKINILCYHFFKRKRTKS